MKPNRLLLELEPSFAEHALELFQSILLGIFTDPGLDIFGQVWPKTLSCRNLSVSGADDSVVRVSIDPSLMDIEVRAALRALGIEGIGRQHSIFSSESSDNSMLRESGEAGNGLAALHLEKHNEPSHDRQ